MSENKEEILVPAYSEFNRIIEVNREDLILSNKKVLSMRGFECLFDNFQEIISVEPMCKNIAESFHEKIEYNKDFRNINERYTEENYQSFICEIVPKIKDDFKLNFMPCYPNYSFFKDNCKLFFEDKFLIKPYLHEYEHIKTKFSGKKLVCINGRNAKHKHQARNNTMYNLILKLIASGYFVVNCTISPPNFNIDSNSYLELSENVSYNEVVALFSNSHCVVSIQNAAGISTHLMTEANFILLPNNESWVNNPEYGYSQKSQVQLRKEKGYYTEIISEEEIVEAINSLKPPIINKFSDTNKIIKI